PYGYIHAQTPTYDHLATEGTTFLRAYSSCPLTIPSHSTILSGLYPPTHGVRDNGDFVLSEDTVLISERLQETGYRTAAFTAAFPTQARWGFDQGFDVYHDPLERQPTQLDWSDQRRAEDVIDDALAQLEQWSGEEPVFFWVHLFDAHWPYDPPEPFAATFITSPYDGEIAYADAQVGRLLEAWDAGQGADSVVMITADHGEGLGDGGEQTHGFLLHDGTTRVPMIVRGPGMVRGAVEDDVVGLVDVTPTLLSFAGLPMHDGIQGASMLTGGSESVYSEALTGQFNLGLAPMHSLTSPEGRYMEGGYGAWYRTISDNQIATFPLKGTDLEPHRNALGMVRAQLDEVVAPSASLTADDLAMLQALGYIGDTTAEAGEVDPRDVIDIIPLTWQVRQLIGQRQHTRAAEPLAILQERMPGTFGVDLLQAQLHRATGNLPEAYASFTSLYLRSPSSTLALQLASLEEVQGDLEQALSWYEEAQLLQSASPEAMEGRVRMLLALSRPTEAAQIAAETLRTYPDHSRVRLINAQLLVSEHRLDEARAEATAALDQIPWSPFARQLLAEIQWSLGEPDEAIDGLRDALSMEPYSVPRRMLLTEWFLEVGRNAESVRTITPLTRALPDDAAVLDLHQRTIAALEEELSR
ncbi:MAG: choline-sulfatase, partial [Myxococcota bacterium]